MAESYRVLGQSRPAASVLTDTYTVASPRQAAISTINVCNSAVTPTTYRISIAVAGAVDGLIQYIFYDDTLDGNETKAITTGYSLNSTDVVRCFSASGNVSFSVFGVEIF